jgi:Carboxypeptidase regulatory-like domain
VDKTGTLLAGVHVRLTRDEQTTGTEVISGEDGQFEIVNAAPGAFQLEFTATGFAAQSYAGTLHSGEVLAVSEVTLQVATEVTTVRVEESTIEIAQEQIHEQEKQRVLAVIPNFYVSYAANPAPLDTKQKYELAWKSTLDPVTFVVVGAIAGVQQATDSFSGYGQGAQGYAKRYGATYADILTGTFLGSAVFPSLMHQDPRYFYKGTGSVKSRFAYAVANAVICKGDNMHWQLCYSSLLGSLAAGGISNAYYPASDRGAALTFENFGIGIGATAAVNLLQEFVLRKLTSHSSQKPDPANP